MVAVLAGTLLLAALASCGRITIGAPPDPLREFVDAVNARDFATAAAKTSDPAAAEKALTDTFEGMAGATAHLSTLESLRGTLTTHIGWTLPNGSKTETTGTIGRVSGGTVPWSPHIIDSRLEPGGRLVYRQELDYMSPVIGRHREPVMTWQTVTDVTIAADAPATDIDAAADALHGVDPTITAESIEEGIAHRSAAGTDGDDDGDSDGGAAGDGAGGDYPLITLREDDVAPLRARLDAIPTVTLTEQGRLLTVDPALHSPALQQVPAQWHEVLQHSAGWAVDVDNPGTDDYRVQAKSPEDVQNVPITMDVSVQRDAQAAVDSTTLPAVIVALAPSDGGVLAVAQNAAADGTGPVALSGLYPPGAAFAPITAAAALGSGDADPDDPVDCPAEVTVDGRTLDNPDGLALGAVPLTTAVARGCTTTQALLGSALKPGDLPDTAEALGLGADFDTPGLTTVTGSVPHTDDGSPARAGASIGQGGDVASPFGMAVTAASLAAKGRRISPMLFTDRPAAADDPPATVSESTARAVRSMMREAAQSGSASALRGIDGLAAVAGTADTADRRPHGWCVGIRGDMAFAVFVLGAGDAGPALDVAGRFLQPS